jgi:probable F420-dependent oxidoreductase
MQFGVSFPQDQTMGDPGAVREFAQAVEGLGFDYLTISDHVLGADPAYGPGRSADYTYETVSREPLVLLGYLAACTTRLTLGMSILILPQRQTALVAKQAAEVDMLSGGRLRLGVGIGWNEVEFDALGQEFHNRGRRVEEQLEVLRALWTQEVVTFSGRWHRITEAGLNPLPLQRPIPIWMGGDSEPAMKRIARLADGWLPQNRSPADFAPILDRFRAYAREAGRDPAGIDIAARLALRTGTPEDWARTCSEWDGVGATCVGVSTNNAGCASVQEHIALLRRFKGAVPA